MDTTNLNVSVYTGYNTDMTGTACRLWNWLLEDRPLGFDRAVRVSEVRREPDPVRQDALKKALPLATTAGVFESRATGARMLSSTGLLCLDIDADDNPDMPASRWFDLAVSLRDSGHCAYFGDSVRGLGYFALIAIDEPTDNVPEDYADYYKHCYRELVKMFANVGVKVDPSCCNVNRLRFMSYDRNALLNLSPEPLPLRESFEQWKRDQARKRRKQHANPEVQMARAAIDAARLTQRIVDSGVSLADSYHDWLHVGMSLASLGEQGRELYHDLSAMSPKYNPVACDRKFDNLLRTCRGQVTIASLVYAAGRYGIR